VLTGEVNTVAELIQKCIDENARMAQDQTEYEKRYDALVQRFDTARAKLDETQAAITKKQAQRQMMENFMDVLRSLPEQVEIFDEGTWYALCDYITVYGKDDIRVTFRNGMEIPV
jgi:chromosome segregation ATPase